jgi:hypothetical protein
MQLFTQVNKPMDRETFERLLQTWGKITRNSDARQYDGRHCDNKDITHGVVIVSKLQENAVCNDCGLVQAAEVVRDFTLRNGVWYEYCRPCRSVRTTEQPQWRRLTAGQNKFFVMK